MAASVSSTDDQASRMFSWLGVTPPASVTMSQSPGAFSLSPPLNSVSWVFGVARVWPTRPLAWSVPQFDPRRGVVVVAVGALDAAAGQRRR